MAPSTHIDSTVKPDKVTHELKKDQIKIGKITWQGNQLISSKELNQALGLKQGDVYDSLELSDRLNFKPDGSDVTSLYMDQGYLYFYLEAKKEVLPNGVVNLDMQITEGMPVKIRNITVKGNKTMSTQEVLQYIPIQSGDLFSRSKLIQAQRQLAQSGYFDSKKVMPAINPIRRKGNAVGMTDIEFSLIEKSN